MIRRTVKEIKKIKVYAKGYSSVNAEAPTFIFFDEYWDGEKETEERMLKVAQEIKELKRYACQQPKVEYYWETVSEEIEENVKSLL